MPNIWNEYLQGVVGITADPNNQQPITPMYTTGTNMQPTDQMGSGMAATHIHQQQVGGGGAGHGTFFRTQYYGNLYQTPVTVAPPTPDYLDLITTFNMQMLYGITDITVTNAVFVELVRHFRIAHGGGNHLVMATPCGTLNIHREINKEFLEMDFDKYMNEVDI